jgi:antitoxin (DNA-binding transcriptional repressor) of toxin-antitoxin stability system
MIVTVEQAQTTLAEIIALAQAGEEVLIESGRDRRGVRLVPFDAGGARLTRHPDLVGSTAIHDPAALLQPLPEEEWGELAKR